MNYKKMALVLFLVPMMSCAKNVQDIKQLEQKKESLQAEIAHSSKYINEQAELLDIYKQVAMGCWDSGEEYFLEKEDENEFNSFIDELKNVSKNGENIFTLIE